jgi:transcriptional regulator GlxA family with amidase domain
MASFRRLCGITLWEYVTRMRVAESRRLLDTTDLSIATVSERSGFGSLSRMYDAFQRYVDKTPAEYRRRARSTRAAREELPDRRGD